MLFLAIHRGPPKFSSDQTSSFNMSRPHNEDYSRVFCRSPNDAFLLNTLKILFRLSIVLLDV